MGPSVRSDAFALDEIVIVYVNVTYNGWPEQNNDVTFRAVDNHGITSAPTYARTNSSGIATESFRLPYASPSPEYWVGDWAVIATASVAGIGKSDVVPFTTYAPICGLTISCNPNTIDKTGAQSTKVSGYLRVGSSGLSGKTITLKYRGGATGPDVPPSDGDWTSIAQSTTASGGYYEYFWDAPSELPNGYYWIEAVFEGDATCPPVSGTTGVDLVPNLFVVPLFPYGVLSALAACFAGYAIFARLKSAQRPKR